MAGESSVLGSVFADIGRIQSKLNSLSDKSITININTKDAMSKITGLTDSINNLRNIAIEPIKITIDIDQAKLQDIQNTITAIQQQAQNAAKGMANTVGANAAAKAQQQAQQQAQQVAKEAAKQAQQIAQQFNQKVNASGKPYEGMTSVISVDNEEVKKVQKLNEALGQTRTIATDLKSGSVTEKMTTDYEKMAKEQDRINKFFSDQKMTYDNLMSGISKQNPLQGDFLEAAKKSLEDYRAAYESVEQQVRSGEALDLSKITRVREALQATSNAIKEQYAGQKQSLADQLQLDKAGQQVSKLKTQVEELFSKSFNRNNPLSGDFAKPVTDKFTELRTTLENLGNLAGSGDTSKIQEVTQGVRDAVTAYKELDTLRRNQQSAQWQSNQLSATDITAQIPILKNQVTLLQKDLDKLGFGEHFKSQVDGLKDTIRTLSSSGGSTQSFFSQMRQLRSDIEVFKEKPLGKGLMESVKISDTQLDSIKNITKLLNMQQSNESIVAAKNNLQNLANEYQNIQRQLQDPKIGTGRYNDLLGREGRLDQQLKEYEAMSKHLSGGPASQDWIAQQETGIERLRAKYAQYQNEIGKTIQLTPELQSQMDSLSETFNRQGGIDILNWKSVEQQFSQLQARIEQFKASTQGMASQLATGISGTNLPQIDGLIDKLNNIDANYSGAGVQNMIDRLNDLKTQYQDVMTQLQNPNLTQDQFTGLADKVKELQDQFKQLADKAKIFNDGIKSDEALAKYETDLGNVTRKFEDLKTRYADLAKSNPQIAAKFDEVGQAIAKTDPTNIAETSRAVNDLGRACASAAGQTGGLRGALESAFGGFGSYLARFTSAYFIITKTIQGIKSMVNEVKAVDTSMVELQKVTNLSGESLTQFSEKSYEIGRGLGRTGKDVMDAVTTFSRAGYDLNEATQLAQSALVMTNVGVDIQNTEQAASDMISILKAYEIQASESAQVIDELYNVANKEPLDFGNITEMLVTAGGTLHQTGTDLEETMGLLTGAFATMRDTSVANGLIMISQRLRGVKEDGEAIEEEGFMPKLKDAFGNVGVQIEDSNGELRSTYDILHDLAGVWDSLSSKQKQFLGEKAAGNRQVKTLNAIMQNWEIVEDTIDKANEAQGAATVGNEKYLDSIQGRIVQLKTAFQELATETISSDFVKGIVSVGTSITKLVTNIGGLVPVLTTVMGIVTALKSAQIAKGLLNIGNAIKGLFAGLGSLNALGVVGIIAAVASIAIAIGNATGAFESAATKAKKAADTSKQAYADQKTKVESLNSELKNTQSLISDLESKGHLTVVEQGELARLKETNDELQRQLDLEEARLKMKESQARRDAVEAMAAYDESTWTDEGFFKSHPIEIPEAVDKTLGREYFKGKDYKVKPDYYSESTNEVRENLDQYIDSIDNLNQIFEISMKDFVEMNKDAISKARENRDKAKQAYDTTWPILKEGEELTEDQLEQRETDAETVETVTGYYEDIYKNIESYYDYLNELTNGLPRIEDAKLPKEMKFNELVDMRDQLATLLTNEAMFDMSTSQQANIILGRYADVIKEVKDKIKETGQISQDDLFNIDGFDSMLADFERYGWTIDSVTQHLNEFYGIAQTEQPKMVTSLAQIMANSFKASESYKTLTAAIDEQNKAGVLSMETYQKLLDDKEGLPGIAEHLVLTANGYVLNTKALTDYVKVREDADEEKAILAIIDKQKSIEELSARIDELKAKQGELTEAEQQELAGSLDQVNGYEAEIAALQAYIRTLNEGTAAFAAFKAAQATPNGDTGFKTGQSAYDVIKEGNKTGKIGTDDYEAAMGAILGENWETTYKNKGGKEAAIKDATRLGKRYLGQKNDYQGMENFFKDLDKNEFAKYNSKTGALEMLTNPDTGLPYTINQMADTLGISADLVTSMFKLAEDFDYKFDYPELKDGDDQRIDEKKWQEQQDRIKETNEALDGQVEKRNELSDAIKKAEESGADQVTFDDGTTMGLEEARETLDGYNEGIDKTAEELEKLQSGEAPEVDINTLSIEEALKLFEQLDDYKKNGFPLTFTMQGQYEALRTLLTDLGLLKSDPNFGVTLTADDQTTTVVQSAEESLGRVFGDGAPYQATLTAKDDTSTGVNSAKSRITKIFGDGAPYEVTLEAEDDTEAGINEAEEGLRIFGDGAPYRAELEAKDDTATGINSANARLTRIFGDGAPYQATLEAEDNTEIGIDEAEEGLRIFGDGAPYRAELEAKDDTATGINSANSRITRIFGDGAPYQATLEADDQTEETGLGTANEKLSTYEETPHNAKIGVEIDNTSFAAAENKFTKLTEPRQIQVQLVDEDGNPIGEPKESEAEITSNGFVDSNGQWHGAELVTQPTWGNGTPPQTSADALRKLQFLKSIPTSDLSPQMLEEYNSKLQETIQLYEQLKALEEESKFPEQPEENTPPELPGQNGDNPLLDPIEGTVDLQPKEGAAETISEGVGTVEIGYTLTQEDGNGNPSDGTGEPTDPQEELDRASEVLSQMKEWKEQAEKTDPASLFDFGTPELPEPPSEDELGMIEFEAEATDPEQPYNEVKEAAESSPPVEIPSKLVKEDDGGESGEGGNGDGVDPSDFSYVQLANTADRTGEMLTNGIAQAKGNTQQIKDAQSSMRDFLLATNDYNNPVEGAAPDMSAFQSAADDVLQKYDALKATMGEGFEFDAETQTVLDKIEEIRTKAEEPVVIPIKPEEKTSEVETPEPGNVEGGTVSYSADMSQVNGALDSVDTSVDVDVSSNADSVSRDIDNAAKDRSTTITVNYKTTGTPPTGLATGTKNAKGGPALVDDGGGAELIEHVKRGTFELGTNSGPRLTTLDKGDVVHTAEETKKIMSRLGKVGGFFRSGLNKAKSILTGGAFATGMTGGGTGAWKKVIDDVRKTSGSKGRSSSGSTGGSSTKKWKAWLEKLFDWAEIRLDRLKRITETWLLSAAEAIGYIAKNKELNGALESINDQIEQTSQAYDLYMKQAGKVQKKLKLSDKLVEKIQKGDIEISSYSKEKQEKIRAYQEWFWPQSHFE